MKDFVFRLLFEWYPYICATVFFLGSLVRFEREQYTWRASSSQVLRRRQLVWGSNLFHFGILFVIGGHVLGILIPRSWTDGVGISHEVYHWISVVMGGAAGVAVSVGFAILVARRLSVARVRAATLRSDVVLYPVLAVTIAFGMLATFWGNAADRYEYRETVSPWFRGIFLLQPQESLMTSAPFVFQAHAVTAFLLFAVWPFTRLVHVWSVPIAYVGRPPILYRRRRVASRPAAQRSPSR